MKDSFKMESLMALDEQYSQMEIAMLVNIKMDSKMDLGDTFGMKGTFTQEIG
jgi:hypothetical protein